MAEPTFAEGDFVFAISDGYPNWPGVIRGSRKSKTGTQYRVRYFDEKEADSDWLGTDEVFAFDENVESMGHPKFDGYDDPATELKRRFHIGLDKVNELKSKKSEEPAGRRGRPSEVASPAVNHNPAKRKPAGDGTPAAASPKRQKNAAAAGSGAATPASPKKLGRPKKVQPAPEAAAAPEAAPEPEEPAPEAAHVEIKEVEVVLEEPAVPASPKKVGRPPKEKKEPASPKPKPVGRPKKAANGAEHALPAAVEEVVHAAAAGLEAGEDKYRKAIEHAIAILQAALDS
ncbi:hypothetical protein DFJ74DRAFT_686490 [Hyaloraphidium curvatum]|nr:hypothetical protein DFJ74DRAFT_686490 [Hyaloraphidium curvatum]